MVGGTNACGSEADSRGKKTKARRFREDFAAPLVRSRVSRVASDRCSSAMVVDASPLGGPQTTLLNKDGPAKEREGVARRKAA
jgi:hypothetical protein